MHWKDHGWACWIDPKHIIGSESIPVYILKVFGVNTGTSALLRKFVTIIVCYELVNNLRLAIDVSFWTSVLIIFK